MSEMVKKWLDETADEINECEDWCDVVLLHFFIGVYVFLGLAIVGVMIMLFVKFPILISMFLFSMSFSVFLYAYAKLKKLRKTDAEKKT